MLEERLFFSKSLIQFIRGMPSFILLLSFLFFYNIYRKRGDPRSRTDRVQQRVNAWRQQLPHLVEAYLLWNSTKSDPRTSSFPLPNSTWKINILDFYREHAQMILEFTGLHLSLQNLRFKNFHMLPMRNTLMKHLPVTDLSAPLLTSLLLHSHLNFSKSIVNYIVSVHG